MTRREQILLAVAAGLVALAAWQYWPQGDAPGVAPAPGAGTVRPAARGLNPLAGRDGSSLAALAAHPLFTMGRMPPVVEAPAPAPAPAPAAMPVPAVAPPPPEPATEPPAPTPVLQGVVVTPAPGGAFLGDGIGGESRFLRPGQSALGLTLQEVFADHAIFRGAEGEVDLPLVKAAPPPPVTDPAEPVVPAGGEVDPNAPPPPGPIQQDPARLPDDGSQQTVIPGMANP